MCVFMYDTDFYNINTLKGFLRKKNGNKKVYLSQNQIHLNFFEKARESLKFPEDRFL